MQLSSLRAGTITQALASLPTANLVHLLGAVIQAVKPPLIIALPTLLASRALSPQLPCRAVSIRDLPRRYHESRPARQVRDNRYLADNLVPSLLLETNRTFSLTVQ